MAEQRVLEAKKLGFKQVILPKVCMGTVEKVTGIELLPVATVAEAAKLIL